MKYFLFFIFCISLTINIQAAFISSDIDGIYYDTDTEIVINGLDVDYGYRAGITLRGTPEFYKADNYCCYTISEGEFSLGAEMDYELLGPGNSWIFGKISELGLSSKSVLFQGDIQAYSFEWLNDSNNDVRHEFLISIEHSLTKLSGFNTDYAVVTSYYNLDGIDRNEVFSSNWHATAEHVSSYIRPAVRVPEPGTLWLFACVPLYLLTRRFFV